MNDYTPQSFAQALRTKLGYPITKLNVADIMSWENAEGGHWNNSAHFNPLNTTQSMPDSSSMNSVGVKAYKSWDDGIAATVKTLKNGYYATILEDLKAGGNQNFGETVASTPWGTGHFTVNISPKLPVGAIASKINLVDYPGLTLNNGVYQISYSPSIGSQIATVLGIADQNAVKDTVHNWNQNSTDLARRHGTSSLVYIQWVQDTLPDMYGSQGALIPSGGNDTGPTVGSLGLDFFKKEWWVILIVILAGVLLIGLVLKNVGGPKQIVQSVAAPIEGAI